MWVAQLCFKKVLSHFSPRKKVAVLSMINCQSLTPSATWLTFGGPSSACGTYTLSDRIHGEIPEVLKGIRSLQTFAFL